MTSPPIFHEEAWANEGGGVGGEGGGLVRKESNNEEDEEGKGRAGLN
eukprot:CAMPEP_0195004702 /NCGR_PEP_ID=MMETSP0326_2-20130528/4839_1 /TAXON_ID=2866 ORGANISM="Crypthecodinium cohnii, Strain Seligo" /NCGR_SAMPLE_ID=MMETSP0326_2 /ASSEMBLY_ACC=CAM_ASM_000348 /LENGTH=46 /DNA_ID= /DNA_START= /DNA_END= /DNA_ORIENTATION=